MGRLGLLFLLALVVLPALVSPDQGSSWLVVHNVLSSLAPLAALVIGLLLCRERITRRLLRELLKVSGPPIVAALPPRVVLSTLLQRIYGDSDNHDSIVVGILGGAGRDVRGRDIATSRRTVVDFRLRSIDDNTYSLISKWTHRLSGVLDSYNLVVFATCDPELWSLIPSERRSPLYESWFVQDEELLEGFVPHQRQSLKVGISYRDRDRMLHTVDPRAMDCSEPREYSDFVHLPDGTDLDNLRILQFDLGQLVDPDHVVDAIETLSVQAVALESTADGFLTWSPPYPCFVEQVGFDVAELHLDREDLLFKVLMFTMDRPCPTFANTWVSAEEVRKLPVGSWLLPGHGVTLLWRRNSRVDGEPENRP